MSDNGNPTYGPNPTNCNDEHYGQTIDDSLAVHCLGCDFAQQCMDAWVATGAMRPLHNQDEWAKMLGPDPDALYFQRLLQQGVDPHSAAAEIDMGCMTEAEWMETYAVVC